MSPDIRWKQRYDNFDRAFHFLKSAVELGQYDDLQAAGLIQSFEFTFELGWKTLKDYLEEGGYDLPTPRTAIKQAFQSGLIEDGHCWLDMLKKRNQLSHTYTQEQSRQAIDLIRATFFPSLQQVHNRLTQMMEE